MIISLKGQQTKATIATNSISNPKTFFNTYECDCRMVYENALGCYIVKLIAGKNILNPQPKEFLFSIINEKDSFYRFFRGYQPPFSYSQTSKRLIMTNKQFKLNKLP